MQFKITAALCAALLTAVAESRIAFTTLPGSVSAGKPVKLSWSGSDGTPITITLKQGDPNNLKTVALITGSASGNSFTWTPSSSLPSGNNYALQIAQDDTDVNYTGLFSISGGSSSSSSSGSSSSSSSASASASSSASSSSSPSAAAGVFPASGVSNTTATTTAAPQGTAPAGSAGVTGGSASRNTTLSRASLTRTSSSRSSSTSESTSTTSEDSAAATTASSSQTGAAVTIASNIGLLLAGFAAVVYLG